MQKIVYSLVLVLMSSFVFVSCGGDDDDLSVNPVVKGVTTDEDGNQILLTRVGSTYISYDENGRLSGLGSMYGNGYTVADKTFTLTYDDEETLNVSFNKMGYISRVTFSDNYRDGDEWENTTGSVTFTYNASKQITSIVKSWSSKFQESAEDGVGTESETSTCNYTWKDGNLTEVSDDEVFTSNYGDGIETEKTSMKAQYTYGNQKNPLLQVPYGLHYHANDTGLSEEPYNILACLGFFGVGTVDFPTYMESEYVETDEDGKRSYNQNSSFSYTLNSDNTIATERISLHYQTLYYGYTTLSEAKAQSRKGIDFAQAVKELTAPRNAKSHRARRAARR